MKNRAGLGRQRENRSFYAMSEKGGVKKGLEAVESNRRKRVKGISKTGLRGYVKNILWSDFNASLS